MSSTAAGGGESSSSTFADLEKLLEDTINGLGNISTALDGTSTKKTESEEDGAQETPTTMTPAELFDAINNYIEQLKAIDSTAKAVPAIDIPRIVIENFGKEEGSNPDLTLKQLVPGAIHSVQTYIARRNGIRDALKKKDRD